MVLGGYYLVGNEQGLDVGLGLAALTSFGSWYDCDRSPLMSYRAQPLAREEAPAKLSMKATVINPMDEMRPGGFNRRQA